LLDDARLWKTRTYGKQALDEHYCLIQTVSDEDKTVELLVQEDHIWGNKFSENN
ncbi:4943_t:CDS:2, partial [Paraglomus brasilianum]